MGRVRVGARRRWVAVALAAGAVPIPALAADRYWQGGNNPWQTAASWNTLPAGGGAAGAPVNGDNAYIRSALDLTVTRDNLAPAYAVPGLALVELSNAGTSLTQLTLATTSNALVSTDMIVGATGRGTVVQMGGSNVVTGTLTLASAPGSTGAYDLSGGRLNVTTLTEVGGSGGATFVQSGGTHTAGGLHVSGVFGRPASYTLSAGTVNVSSGSTIVGYKNFGTFTQSGGSHSAQLFIVGDAAPSSGTYTLSGGNLTTGLMTVANGGRGRLDQSGGAVKAGTLSVADGIGSIGTYGMSNGASLTADTLRVGRNGDGAFNQTGGVVATGLRLEVGGVVGTGTVNIAGGTFGAAAVHLGGVDSTPGGTGNLSLSGGAMTVTNEVKSLKSNSGITLSGGTLSAAALVLPDWNKLILTNGTLNLSGGVSTNAGTLNVGGLFATGVAFNQTGGSVSATGDLKISAVAGGSAAYTLASGSLGTQNSAVANGGVGAFTQNGGTHTASGQLFVGNSGSGVYNQNSGSMSAAVAVVIGRFEGFGVYNLAGGTLTTIGLNLGNSGGTATLGIMIQSGGSTSVNFVRLGDSGGAAGELNANGGSLAATSSIVIANSASGTTASALNLNGGTVSAQSLITPDWARAKLNRGTLSLKDGSSSSAGNLDLGGGTGATTVNLSGGLLKFGVAGTESLGTVAGAVATLNQSAGTHTVGVNLSIARAPGSTAAVNLSGGTLTVPTVYVGGDGAASGGVGTLNVNDPGTLTASGTVKVWNAASSIRVGYGLLSTGALDLPADGPATMLTLDGGRWRHTGGSMAMNHDFTSGPSGGELEVASAGTMLTLGGTSSGPGTLIKSGPGTLKVTGSLASSFLMVIRTGKYDAAVTQTLRRLGVGENAAVVVSAGVLTVGDGTYIRPLSLENGTSAASLMVGHLDVTTRGLIVDYVAGAGNDATALASVRREIVSGRNGGEWNGAGIASSAAAANASDRAVGYALAGDVPGAIGGAGFLGDTSIDASSVLVRYTYMGDANLDGAVGFADLVAVAQHYDTTGGGSWATGDFDYDGNVGFSDLVAVAQNYDQALPADGAFAGAGADFNRDLTAAFASLPEPSAALPGAVLLLSGLSLRRRRR